MPVTVYVIALAVFAQGTSEFMLSGLIPDIAADLGVSVPDAGRLTSAFAVGMIVGAPLVALFGARLPRRASLASFLLVFLAAHVVGALTDAFGLLLVTRVLAALANAGFLAVGLAAATALAGPGATGRATAVVLSGTTLATIAGVPLGALLGDVWGWRSAFWAVAALSLPPVVAILRSVPPTPPSVPGASRPDARRELRALRDPGLLVTLLLGALVNGGTFCTFTYLAPIVTGVARLGDGWVPAALAVFGAGSFLGVNLGGRLADRRPMLLLTTGSVALLAGWLLFALTAGHPFATIGWLLVQGTLSFAVGSTLITRVLTTARGAPTLAGGVATASLNVGAAAGPALGGLVIAAGLGFRSPILVSAALVAVALLVGGVALAAARLRDGRPVDAPS